MRVWFGLAVGFFSLGVSLLEAGSLCRRKMLELEEENQAWEPRTRDHRHRARSTKVPVRLPSEDELAQYDPHSALRTLIRNNRQGLSEGFLKSILHGRAVESLAFQEALAAYFTALEELEMRPMLAAQKEKFEGYYAQFQHYQDHQWESERRFEMGILSSRKEFLPVDRSAVFLDSSFMSDNYLAMLYEQLPSLANHESQMVLLPSVASEHFSLTAHAKNRPHQSGFLSSKFKEKWSDAETQGFLAITREFQSIGVGADLSEDDATPQKTLDPWIVAEAIMAASASADNRAELWVRDENFFAPLWAAAFRMQIPFENDGYSFQIFADSRMIDGVGVPVVKIVTQAPVQSELMVIHPYLRVSPFDKERLKHIKRSYLWP